MPVQRVCSSNIQRSFTGLSSASESAARDFFFSRKIWNSTRRLLFSTKLLPGYYLNEKESARASSTFTFRPSILSRRASTPPPRRQFMRNCRLSSGRPAAGSARPGRRRNGCVFHTYYGCHSPLGEIGRPSAFRQLLRRSVERLQLEPCASSYLEISMRFEARYLLVLVTALALCALSVRAEVSSW